jgi:hypothetical protein
MHMQVGQITWNTLGDFFSVLRLMHNQVGQMYIFGGSFISDIIVKASVNFLVKEISPWIWISHDRPSLLKFFS